MKTRRSPSRGFTVVELLCVLAIVATLAGMALPAIQSIRESSRRAQCESNVRQIVMATVAYNATHQRLPPGTLGYDRVLNVPAEMMEPDPNIPWFNPASPEYWKNAQHTSGLTLITPHLEGESLAGNLPEILRSTRRYYAQYRLENPGAPEWIGDIPEVRQAMEISIGVFLCPSDSLEQPGLDVQAAVTSQPVYVDNPGRDGLFVEMADDSPSLPAATNYLFCAGAHSGGRQPNPELDPFRGYGSCRERMTITGVKDGASQTILVGENIGGIQEGNRKVYFSWMFGGLVRGRGILPWRKDRLDTLPEFLLLGDPEYAFLAGFGSVHPDTVMVGMGDGSTRGISRLIDIETFYALTGGYDGVIPLRFE